MKKGLLPFLLIVLAGSSSFAQTESYTARKVTGNHVPVIDGVIESVWGNVEKVPLTKVPEQGGQVHPNITVPNPDSTDYYAEIGMVWNDNGIFFYFRVVDDLIVIEDDYNPNNSTPADQWWTDDNINILFSKDLINASFTQWEFAWQPGIDFEEKLSSDRWLNAAKIDSNLVQSAWFNDGKEWILETFIDWTAFNDGFPDIYEGKEIFLEARARDDDDGGAWESMYHWSSTNYDLESTGIGLGTVTLSPDEVATTGILVNEPQLSLTVSPNPTSGVTDLGFSLDRNSDVTVQVFDLSGKMVLTVKEDRLFAGTNHLDLNLSALEAGVYLVQMQAGEKSGVTKLVKE